MNPRCGVCARTDVATTAYRCTWPDARTTLERYCVNCGRIWIRQLLALGARIEEDRTREEPLALSSAERT